MTSLFCTRLTCWVWTLKMLAHWNNTLSPSQFYFYSLIGFKLLVFKPQVCCTWAKHIHHYATKAVWYCEKKSLNSDDRQFHQYQQDKQLPLASTIKYKKIMIYGVGNPGLGLRQAQKCGRVKLVNGISTFLFFDWMFEEEWKVTLHGLVHH